MKILIFLLLAGSAIAQYPDAPGNLRGAPGIEPPPLTFRAPEPLPVVPRPPVTCGRFHWPCWDYSHPSLSVGNTFKSKYFWPGFMAGNAAYAVDAWKSYEAIHDRGCLERDWQDLGPRPGAGDFTVNWVKTELPAEGLRWLFVKLNRRPTNYMAQAIEAYRIQIHIRGAITAVNCGR